MNINILTKKIIGITLFAIAMGFLETSVVVYLRELLYPGGFNFPLAPMKQTLIVTEFLREAATLVMLITIGYLTGKSFSTRFAWFIYTFAVWDIFYYIFLKILLNWPESWFTWDILFLIPTTWSGPVLAPVITSLSMILLALIIVMFDFRNYPTKLSFSHWMYLICGSVIVILSFTLDYSFFILEKHAFTNIWLVPREDLMQLAYNYIPRKFNWWIFAAGQVLIALGIIQIFRNIKRQKSPLN